MGRLPQPKGEKTALVQDAVKGFPGDFNVADILRTCHGVGIDMIRWVLKDFGVRDLLNVSAAAEMQNGTKSVIR